MQNVGVSFSTNLGISLVNKDDLDIMTAVDDFSFLMSLSKDKTLQFKNIYVKNDLGKVEWAFQFDDEEEDTDEMIWFYPVTRLELFNTSHRGFVETIFSAYGLDIKFLDEIGNGIYKITVDGVKQTK